MNQQSILIVDDDRDIVQLINVHLKQEDLIYIWMRSSCSLTSKCLIQ